MESKIQFLETGNYSTEEFVNSRAIKLKKTMMSNLVYNRDSLYGLTDEAANEIVNGPIAPEPEKPVVTSTPEEDIKAQQEKLAQEVQKIMAEQEAVQESPVAETPVAETPAVENERPVESETTSVPVEIPMPVVEETPVAENVVDEPPKVEIPVESVNKTEVYDAINEAMSAINVDEPVQREEIYNAIDEEMEKIKVSSNESTPAKVNKFINEDGTYRLRREDIPEEFRITRIDRDEMPQTAELPEEEVYIPPFGENIVRETPDIEIPRKAITPIPETKKYIIEPIEFPKVNINLEVQEDQPAVE